jgi:hypothetical protein
LVVVFILNRYDDAMKYGKIRPQAKVIDHWQVLWEKEITVATTTVPITNPYNVLMISGEGVDSSTSVIDECGHTVTCNGNAQIDTAQKKFGVSSVLFDGTGDYLSLASSTDWYFGSGDFTIDFWVRKNADGTFQYPIGCGDGNTGPQMGWFVEFNDTNHVTGRIYITATGSRAVTSTGTITAGAWHHIAFVRDGNTLRLFIDGIADGTLDVTGIIVNNITTPFRIGDLVVNTVESYFFNGWLDDIRISKGIARWTSDFTPPLKTTALVNGDVDEEYKLLSNVMISTAATYPALRLNNDSGANYGYQTVYGAGVTISASRSTSSFFILYGATATSVVGDFYSSSSIIYAKSGYLRTALTSATNGATTTVDDLSEWGQTWNNTTAPISSLVLFSYNGNEGLGVGTKFILYRKVYP